MQYKTLWNTPDYDKAMRQCSVIAHEDYKFAKRCLEKTCSTLTNLKDNIELAIDKIEEETSSNTQNVKTKELARKLNETRTFITSQIIGEIERLRDSMSGKQHAIDYFTIAFMGKTKAGKSTLHAILSGEGWEAIGVGKQRTTRENREYIWNNIRIIDTPGIGAPGGESDEEIAKRVIDESDVICYVVTNNNTQAIELKFLQLLKEKAKPLVILLNVHKNLRDFRWLEYFLNNPDKLFSNNGNNSINEHIERIQRYAKEQYANDYFDIIPVMLLAALMSCEPEHEQQKQQLFQASRIQDFLDCICDSIVKHGTIRRSQTILGSTANVIEHSSTWLEQQAAAYQELSKALAAQHFNIKNQIEQVGKDIREELLQKIEDIYKTIFNSIHSFAEEHWNYKEQDLNRRWWKNLKSLYFEESLNNAYHQAQQKLNQEICEIIREYKSELELIAQFELSHKDSIYWGLPEQDTNNIKELMQLGGGILGVVGAITFPFAAPIAVPVGIASLGIGGAANLFKSQSEKRTEAVFNISIFLKEQLKQHKADVIRKIEFDFDGFLHSFQKEKDDDFYLIRKEIKEIVLLLEKAKNNLELTTSYLNSAYAKRIIDWCLKCYEPLTRKTINSVITEVKRDFGRGMVIKTKFRIILQRSPDEINKILQEHISISIPHVHWYF